MKIKGMPVKEFFKRWKQGMNEVSPFQQAKIRLIGQFITLVGIVSGMITVVLIKQYLFMIILIGALIVQVIAIIGDYQQYSLHKNIETISNGELIDDANPAISITQKNG